jgi:Ubiquitin carboxyl-terminal hydrolase
VLTVRLRLAPRSLEDCLRLFLEKDELTGDNKWYCEKCKKHTDATKKTDLWVLPPILIIHLKRFKHDDFGRAGRKNEAVLKYPITGWDLSNAVKSRGGGTPTYDLYAVSNHLGGLGGGHYTAYALNRFDDRWYEFNDSTYSSIDPKTTFEQSSSPYLLFYNRVPALVDEVAHPSNPRGILIRRQSVSRPELWPHAQVREGQFREFHRSNNNVLGSNSKDSWDLLHENGAPTKKNPPTFSRANLSSSEEEQEMKPTRPTKKKRKRRKVPPPGNG